MPEKIFCGDSHKSYRERYTNQRKNTADLGFTFCRIFYLEGGGRQRKSERERKKERERERGRERGGRERGEREGVIAYSMTR